MSARAKLIALWWMLLRAVAWYAYRVVLVAFYWRRPA